MLRWCAYCQEFQGEVAPLDDLMTTHGICEACIAKGMERLEDEIPHAVRLRDVQDQLREAGRTGDLEAASRIVNLALARGLRPVDILVGLITPLLYLIGSEWHSGMISVEDEQRFTAFCERVFLLVKAEMERRGIARASGPVVFLTNARGNVHTLGIRILGLWLQSKGVETREFPMSPTPQALTTLAAEAMPRAILISLAQSGQMPYVSAVAEAMQAMPEPRPVLIVGGYAIKHHLAQPVPGAVFVEEMAGLLDLLL